MAPQTVPRTPKVNKRTSVPMRTIRALAKRIAQKFEPEEIILFGSHAYGKPHTWSDVDFLVIMDTPRGEFEAIMEISDALPDLPFRVEIVVRSRKVLEKRKRLGDWFLREITSKGKVMYERTN